MRTFRQAWGRFSAAERKVLLVLLLFVLGGLAAVWQEKYAAATQRVPTAGGRYVEGLVGTKTQLLEISTRLTSVGLVSVTADGETVPVLAREFQISPDGRTYTFHLREGVSSEEVAARAREIEMFRTVEIRTSDPATLQFVFKQPFGPFLSFLSLPYFPYGPYQVAEEREREIRFVANEQFPLGRPYLDDITVRIYPDEASLQEAVARRELTGAVTAIPIPGGQRFTAPLPRRIVAFFNTEREALQNEQTRRRIINGEPLPSPITLEMVTTPQLTSYADRLIERWRPLGVELRLTLLEDAKLKETILPARSYDVLIYGVDAGADPDPYRFWHSSQATADGLNLAQLKDGDLDSLLAEARRIIDDRARYAKYEEIEKRLDSLAVRIVLEQLSVTYQIDRRIKGVVQPAMINAASRYNLVWKWYTKERRIPRSR